MYNIEMFPNIFSEGEILCMEDDFIDNLRHLLDDKVSVRLLEFFERFEASGIRDITDEPIAKGLTAKVDRIKELLYPTIKANTFHLEVMERQLLDSLSQMYIDTALITIKDRKKAIKDLTWLLENRKYWQSYIAPRQKVNYDILLKDCQNLTFAASTLNYSLVQAGLEQGIHYYDNLTTRVKSNKEFFYSPNEKKRQTRMSTIMNTVNTIEIILHGLKYQEMCNEMEIPKAARRSFRA